VSQASLRTWGFVERCPSEGENAVDKQCDERGTAWNHDPGIHRHRDGGEQPEHDDDHPNESPASKGDRWPLGRVPTGNRRAEFREPVEQVGEPDLPATIARPR
jgi:hypothetical protein